MPVNLLGHKAGKSRELSMTVVSKVETMSLRELRSSHSKSRQARTLRADEQSISASHAQHF